MKDKVFLFGVFLFGLAIPVTVQGEERFEKGTLELGVGSSSISRSLEPFVGYFFYDQFEGVIHFAYSHMNDDYPTGLSDATVDTILLSGNFLYHFPTGTFFVPTLGLGLTYANTRIDFESSTTSDVDEDVVSFSGNAGFRFLIGRRASFNWDLTFFTTNIEDNLSTLTLDRSGVKFGISFSLFM